MHISIIGCGNMGKSLAQCLSKKHSLFLYDRTFDKAKHLEMDGFGKACYSLEEAIQPVEYVILATKPQGFQKTANELKNSIKPNQTLISILTGTTLKDIHTILNCHVIRMMPNLSAVYGEGAIGLTADENISVSQRDEVNQVFSLLGKLYWIEEKQFDAFTSLAGSGPAFVLTLIEGMIDAGVSIGLSAEQSYDIVQQMIKGTLVLLNESHLPPAEIKRKITSPGGTTIAGLKKMEENAIRFGLMDTFAAAYKRAIELREESVKA